MVEHFLRQDNAGLAVCNEEAVPVDQGDARDGHGLDRPRSCRATSVATSCVASSMTRSRSATGRLRMAKTSCSIVMKDSLPHARGRTPAPGEAPIPSHYAASARPPALRVAVFADESEAGVELRQAPASTDGGPSRHVGLATE